MKKFKNIIIVVMLFIYIVLWNIPKFLFHQFGEMNLDQILFVIMGNNEGANTDIIYDFVQLMTPIIITVIIIFIITNSIFKYIKRNELNLKISILNYKINNKLSKKLTIIFFVLSSFILVAKYENTYEIIAYIKAYQNAGLFYEENYVDPHSVTIEFPEEKKNLIYIFVESLNTNFSSMKIDNKNDINLIPHLEELALGNISFSHNDGFGGHIPVHGTTWTMGSLVGQTAGVPLSGPLGQLGENSYGKQGFFLPGITSIGDILKENGYNNYYAIGSEASFAGRDVYFSDHGEYEIFDYNYWKENSYIPQDYHVFWGMEDLKLIEFSKEKLLEISGNGEPFNYTMLTGDSHFMDGYIDTECILQYDTEYANAIACADKNVIEFVNWIKDQDFYENTAVILVADHSTMNFDFLSKSHINERTLYNTFLNVEFDQSSIRNENRLFSSVDMFPTTLYTLGVKVDGDRLGLGTNIFSKTPTLLEEFGIDLFNEQLSLRSNYYNENFHSNKDK